METYGQMCIVFCCADAKDRDNVTEQLPASPRLTILTTLTQQLQMLSSEGKVRHTAWRSNFDFD